MDRGAGRVNATNDRLVRCHYIAAHPRRGENQCTGEAVDPEAELLLCTTHLAAAWRMIAEIQQSTLTGGAR